MDGTPKIVSFDSDVAGVFGDVLTQRPARPRTVVGLLGLGYFEYWRMYPELEGLVTADLQQVGERLARHLPDCEVVYPGVVDTLDRAAAAGAALRAAGAEVLVVVAGTYLPDFITMQAINSLGARPPVILFSSQTGVDVSPTDNYLATMRNSALIAMTQLSGSFRKMRLDYDTVVGEIAEPAAYQAIAAKVAAVRAVRRLRASTYGLVGHVFRGMYDLEFDRARVKGFLGPEVMTIDAEHLVELWRDQEGAEVAAAADALFRRFAAKGIERGDVVRSVRLGLAMRRLTGKFNLDGLCFLGQHHLEKMTGAPARMGASMLMEEDGLMVACEGDVGGLVMMDLLHQFTGNVPFQAEWGQFDETRNAVFLLGHGIGVPQQAKSPADVRLTCSPEEWGFKGNGLNYEMIMKPGPVTLGHFLGAGDGYQMLLSRGECLDFPALPCDELHAMVRVQSPVRDYLRAVIDTGAAHHVILAHGDALAALRRTAELMRVKCVVVE